MPDLTQPVATRLQRPSWRDTRLLVGLAIVLLATTLGAKVIAAADDRVPVYAATQLLRPGDELGPDNLAVVQVQLGAGAGRYLLASGAAPTGRYVLREVAAGELVPESAVGERDAVGVQPVTVRVDSLVATALVAGSVVDVYVSRRDRTSTQEEYGAPQRLLTAVTVAWLPSLDRFGTGGTQSAVQLLVPVAHVPDMLAAMDQQDRIALVPVPGSARASGS